MIPASPALLLKITAVKALVPRKVLRIRVAVASAVAVAADAIAGAAAYLRANVAFKIATVGEKTARITKIEVLMTVASANHVVKAASRRKLVRSSNRHA